MARYDHITVDLIDGDGNAFSILGKVTAALRQAGVPAEEIAEFVAEATAGDYDHLLVTVVGTVNVT